MSFELPCGVLHEGKIYRDIRLEPMTGGVLKDIGRRDVRSNPARIIDAVLDQSLVEVEGVGAVTRQILDQMLVADRDYCFFMARKVTFGPKVERTCNCTACGEKADITVSLDDLVFKKLEEGTYEISGQDRLFEIESSLTASTPWKAKFRYPVGSDQQVVAKIGAENIFEAEQHMMWRCLTKWDENEGPFAKSFFEKLRLDVFNDVHAAFKDAQPGLVKLASAICPTCGEEFVVDLGPDFLLQTSQPRGR